MVLLKILPSPKVILTKEVITRLKKYKIQKVHTKKKATKKKHTHTQLTKDKLRFKMHNTQFQEKNKNNDNMLGCMNELLFYQ